LNAKDIMVKTPPHPPSNDKGKPLTAKRKKILELAMAQMRKTRAQMDPSVLSKIRHIIASNPKVMKGLGLDKMPEEKVSSTEKKLASLKDKVLKKVPKVEKQVVAKPVKENASKKKPQNSSQDEVKIDQAHNMEVLAKLMQLKPGEVENIKAILLKSKD